MSNFGFFHTFSNVRWDVESLASCLFKTTPNVRKRQSFDEEPVHKPLPCCSRLRRP